jgi:basic amino acid/polyamine antiporter, APA family
MQVKQLVRRRTTALNGPAESGLRRCLSAFDLTLLGIGSIIGTGIFVLTGLAAATQAGPAVILSFVIAGVVSGFAALAYAELAASIGGSGSAYGYSYVAFGELFAWIIGWDLILEYGLSVAAVADSWSGYFSDALHALGLALPRAIIMTPSEGGLINLPAAAAALLVMVLLILGVKESARSNNMMVLVKLTAIAVFVGVAGFNLHPQNWSPFLPFGWYGHDAAGHPIGVLAGASLVFFAYIGFDAVSTAAEEARNPQRDLPFSTIASLIFCTIAYIGVAGLLTGIVSYQKLNVTSPVAYALQLIGIRWASGLVAAGVIAGLLSVMLVTLYGLTRIMFAMARDGLLPAYFARLNERTDTPVRLIIICGIVIALMAGFIPLGELAELVNIGTLAAYVMVCVGVVVLRYRQPDLHRPFKMPMNPIIPLLGAISCLALMFFLPTVTWLRFFIWLIIGLAVYFGYSMRHSKLALAME